MQYVDWMDPDDLPAEWAQTSACDRYTYALGQDRFKG